MNKVSITRVGENFTVNGNVIERWLVKAARILVANNETVLAVRCIRSAQPNVGLRDAKVFCDMLGHANACLTFDYTIDFNLYEIRGL